MSNIVLIGFMASGKSRVGAHLAAMLSYELIDVDHQIEQEQGQRVSEIFKTHGEAYFRELEMQTIKQLSSRRNTVIVTGGGAPMIFNNAQALKNLGQIFFLDASLSLIIKRLKASHKRPLGAIQSVDDEQRIKDLYLYRRPLYLSLGTTIDVNHQDQTKTCMEIIERYNACSCLEVRSHTPVLDHNSRYNIFHHPMASDVISDIIASVGLTDHRPIIVTTDRLVEILKETINKISQTLARPLDVITFPDGEHHKNFTSIHQLHEQMFSHGLTRKTLVLALGGGNVGDVAGFAAACFMRGVPFIQIPTTLLSMVDASIGGKTGIDVRFGKNLVGAFKNPHAVIIDPNLLHTLPKDDFACGMAEVIKHAIIADEKLFYLLLNDSPEIGTIIERALKVKADIVFNDPKENNIRAHLNLGHTFAHAIEKVSNYQIKHGNAVAIGLVMATRLSQSQGLLEQDFIDDLESLLKKYHLPISLPAQLNQSELCDAMLYDKKRDNAGLKFVLPKKIGEVFVQYVDPKTIFP